MERLSAQDLATLWWDDFGWPGDIGAIAILDGTGLVDRGGRFRIEAVCRAIEPRLHLLPRFRQLLYRPSRGLGWPLWVDAPWFDLADHVRLCPLPASGDRAQLLVACEELRRRRLDPSRPLWEAWFLPGLPDGRVGLFLRMHHAMADGVAGVAAFGALFDVAADAPGPAGQPWTPAPVPPARELLTDNAGAARAGPCSRAVQPGPAGRDAAGGPAHLAGVARGLRRAACPPHQPQQADRPGPQAGYHRQPPRPGQGHRPRAWCQGQRRRARRHRRRPARSAAGPRRTRRGPGPPRDGPGVPARRAARPRERQPGRVDGRAAADRRTRPRPQAAPDHRRDRRAEDPGPPPR